MKHFITFLLLAMNGCVAEIPVMIKAKPQHEEVIPVMTQEAEEILGLPIKRVDSPRGAIFVDVVNVEPGENLGQKNPGTRCRRYIRTEPNGLLFAHELGHALGLNHITGETDEEIEMNMNNLMFYHEDYYYNHPKGTELTDNQFEIIEKEAANLNSCRVN